MKNRLFKGFLVAIIAILIRSVWARYLIDVITRRNHRLAIFKFTLSIKYSDNYMALGCFFHIIFLLNFVIKLKMIIIEKYEFGGWINGD